MKFQNNIFGHDFRVRVLCIAIGTVVNVLLSFLVYHFNIPLFLDTVGTIGVTYLLGLFPGIIVAVLTNVLCALFNSTYIYFIVINTIIAIITMHFVQKNYFKKVSKMLKYVLIISVVSGFVGAAIQWTLFAAPQSESINDAVKAFASSTNIPFVVSFFIVNILINLLDKSLSLGLIYTVIRFIPNAIIDKLQSMFWRQRPLSLEDVEEIKKAGKKAKFSQQKKVTIMLVFAISLMSFVVSFVSIFIYNENRENEYRSNARSAVQFAAKTINADEVDEYINLKEAAFEKESYQQTYELLKNIKETVPGIEYLYALKIKPSGCYYVFDVSTQEVEGNPPGFFSDFEEAFEEYIPMLLAGEQIPPIESDDISGWVLTVYEPVYDSNGEIACYVGADVSLQKHNDYMKAFLIRVLIIISGFYILLLACGLWVTGVFMVYPLNSIALYVKRFTNSGKNQEDLDENVKKLRKLDIRTDDEVEALFRNICDMASVQTEQMRNIRRFSDATSKMQDGLIITMADMVENRDSDTGAHIQKTSAYVRIIIEGLKKKGYYAEKLTEKYISDVIRSAPLHDVGKINIPDNVLNKPGKLTDEEFEIMKTHTTAGKKIMEDAISTVNGENYLKEARNMAAYHHERWDGKGYPEGLHGEVIPLSARIMAVADVFDALTSPRVYKPAFPMEKALKIIEDGAGKQFDPKCVEVFVDSLDEVEVILRMYNQDI